MQIGIIAEGTSDQAVITNILRGLGLDGSDILPLRPDLQEDETDKNYKISEYKGGTWQGVKNDCLEREESVFEDFFWVEDNRFIVIQLDTAEAGDKDFGVIQPDKKAENYSTELRKNVIEKINEWIENQYEDELLYAVCIEETEAWILTIFQTTDTSKSADPKKKLLEVEAPKNKKTKQKSKEKLSHYYDRLTKDFRKSKKLKQFAKRNQSLADFIAQVQEKLENT